MTKAIAQKKVRKQQTSSSDVAQLLHDGVCQTLTAVQLLARILIRKMESEKSSQVQAARELDGLLQKAREELGAVLKQLNENKR